MLNSIFSSTVTLGQVLICTLAALALGLIVALLYMDRNQGYTKGFAVTLALMPAITELIILMVNGNVGTGVAVMGAFSLVRFRSAPGGAREIGCLFLAMALGLCTGAGYLLLAGIFVLLIGGGMLALNRSSFGQPKAPAKELKITIPEELDYEGVFDDLLERYTATHSLERVKTTNMGSLYELTYHVTLKSGASVKAMLDELRCRNGNLNLSLGRVSTVRDEL